MAGNEVIKGVLSAEEKVVTLVDSDSLRPSIVRDDTVSGLVGDSVSVNSRATIGEAVNPADTNRVGSGQTASTSRCSRCSTLSLANEGLGSRAGTKVISSGHVDNVVGSDSEVNHGELSAEEGVGIS